MTRPLVLVVALSLLASACSSSSDDVAETCEIVGTYRISGTLESGNCGPGAESTYTISRNGSGFALEIPGIQGGCLLEQIDTCKAQGKCDIVVVDALDPNNNVAGVSFAWTFTEAGFTGTNTLVTVPAKSMPEACQGTYAITATRL
jgi:hypothetical protein